MSKALSKNLHVAKVNKKDEFYTQLTDIEKELKHYKPHFKNKIVLCNCDDPSISNFFKFFALNFNELGLKKLITTCYKNQNHDLFSKHTNEKAIYIEYDGSINGDTQPTAKEIGIKELKGDGDFRSEECVDLIKKSDIVVTNPPFSLFREYIDQLIRFDKKFLILGHQGAIGYKETFPHIQNKKVWLGVNNGGTKWFKVNKDYDIATESRKKIVDGEKYFSMGNVVWYTNLKIKKREEDLILFKKYSKSEYITYDNYDAIEVPRVAEIPFDYNGVMGVPITFLDKHNPDQFEIIGLSQKHGFGLQSHKTYEDFWEVRPDGTKTGSSGKKTNGNPVVKGVEKGNYFINSNGDKVRSLYTRIFIKNLRI